MNKILLFFVMGICFILAGCDKDDNEESEILLTSQELIQTTWDAELYKYNENGEVEHKESCIIEFLTDTEGLYINGEGSGDPPAVNKFYYQVDKRKIVFENSALVGIWTLIGKSQKQIVLQAYLPQEYKTVLTKKY